jgi:hypothetical protein
MPVLEVLRPRERGTAAFCYSVERDPLTLPVAHVQSKLERN